MGDTGPGPFPVLSVALVLASLGLGCNSGEQSELSALKLSVAKLEQRIATLEEHQQKRAMLNASSPAQPSAVSPATMPDDESLRDDPFLGAPAAPVVMVLFSDYQCQPCRSFYTQSLPRLKADFIDKGQVRFIFRDFPLASNAHAVLAANAAQCAGEQGSYWQMHDVLFEHPELLDQGDTASLLGMTTRLDKKRLSNCINTSRYNREIESDIAAGRNIGMKGAPGFFLGRKAASGAYEGMFIRGAQPYEFIAEVLQSLLSVAPDGSPQHQ